MSRHIFLVLIAAIVKVSVSQERAEPPVLNLYSTFSAQFRAFTLSGMDLKPYNNLQGTILVDADRNKAMIHATMDMDPMEANFDILVDFADGYILTSIPMLNQCQHDELNKTYQLHDLFALIQAQSSYLGT